MEIQSCKYCAVENANKLNLFNEEEINQFIEGVYSGLYNTNNLSASVYKKIAEKLTEGIYKGFEKDLISIEYGTPDYVMLTSLRQNVYVFSAAKSYTQTKEISALLTNKNGLVPFNEFKKEAAKIFDKHNENYLYAEYNSAVAQSRTASMWQDFEKQKEVYNQLEYVTAGDSHVRPEHITLNGIIRSVDDKFWSLYMPPNGWNCRCSVLQVRGEKETDLSTRTPPTQKEVPDLFRFNAGKTKQVFSKHHPYFEEAKKDKDLALKNFNLPLP